ncbi:hypothetical protein MPSEU_000354200 [Mayamaea pseudoterrestris]|nr:hypothetical protein MPSEU_000354200 [Mayamaea pseudoterrestris]
MVKEGSCWLLLCRRRSSVAESCFQTVTSFHEKSHFATKARRLLHANIMVEQHHRHAATVNVSLKRRRSKTVKILFTSGVFLLVVYAIRITQLLSDSSLLHLNLVPLLDEHLTTTSHLISKNPRYLESDNITIGVLSQKPLQFFRQIQDEIDKDDPSTRCFRYGFTYDPAMTPRRIFYGTLMASEPWELFEIVAAEAHGVFSGMVLVEANRTQNFTPRTLLRMQHKETFQKLFGLDNVLIVPFVNELKRLRTIQREHAQRDEIIRGWKTLGMQRDDVGYLADADETFSRDFLRAVQTCQIELLEYEKHKCQIGASVVSAAPQIYEMSPECVTVGARHWRHPDVLSGHCIEGIGDASKNPIAFRREDIPFLRGNTSQVNVVNGEKYYPLYTAADLRIISGRTVETTREARLIDNDLDKFNAYHFHNFFANEQELRHKYFTYGHPDSEAMNKTMEDLHEDLAFVVGCVKNMTTKHPKSKYARVVGGYDFLQPHFRPIYFADPLYRRHRHEKVTRLVLDDKQAALG